MNGTSYTITASHLDVGHGLHRVVRDIDLHTQPGDLVALIGTNGSGKSTLLKTLAGMLPAMHGDLRVLGTRPGSAPKIGRAHV